MSYRWIITLPLSGIAYALSALGCALYAICRKTNSILLSLSGLIFSIAILNGYTEEWLVLRPFRFEYVVPVLMLLFLLPYRSLCLHLIGSTGLRAPLIKELYSFLVLVYAGVIGVMILSPVFARSENPPRTILVLVVLVCALHVPTFAAGMSKVAKFVASSGVARSKVPPDISWSFITTAIVILAIPLVLTLIVQAVGRDDYRLFAVDAVMTAIIFSLLVISRMGQLKEHVSERQVG
jgi:hypothetical protein